MGEFRIVVGLNLRTLVWEAAVVVPDADADADAIFIHPAKEPLPDSAADKKLHILTDYYHSL